MKVAIIGASGKAGKLIMKESLKRGMSITAIVRDKSKISDFDVEIIEKDLFNLSLDDLKGFDTIVSAFGVWEESELSKHCLAMEHLCNILSNSNIRLMIVGGAASLYINKEHTIILLDTPDFPEMFKKLATVSKDAFDILKKSKNITWTYVSPSANFDYEAKGTGSYNIGFDELCFNSRGESFISYEDFALAFVDEIENKKFINKRITFSEK